MKALRRFAETTAAARETIFHHPAYEANSVCVYNIE